MFGSRIAVVFNTRIENSIFVAHEIFLFILFTLLTCSFCNAQIITIPDADFKNALVNTNCVDFNFAIITNDYVTNIEDNLAVNDFELGTSVVLFPNKVVKNLTVASDFNV